MFIWNRLGLVQLDEDSTCAIRYINNEYFILYASRMRNLYVLHMTFLPKDINSRRQECQMIDICSDDLNKILSYSR